MSRSRSPSSNANQANKPSLALLQQSLIESDDENNNNEPFQVSDVIFNQRRRFPRHHNRSWYIDLGPIGNCFVCSIASIFSILFLSLFLTVTIMHLMPYSSTSTSYKNKWRGVYNGTYVVEPGSGHFSSRSASNSSSSMAFRFSATENRLRIDRKVDPEDGRPYFEFKTLDGVYSRKVRFYSGVPLQVVVVKAKDWSMTTRVVITVRKDVWIEAYQGSPPVTVKREFLGGGVLLVNYMADNVIYRKRFKKKELFK